MTFAHILGILLAVGQAIYGQAHVIVAQAPKNPTPKNIQWVIRIREQWILPVGILSLTYLVPNSVMWGDLYGVGVLAATSSVSFLLGLFLYQGASSIRDNLAREMARHENLSKEHQKLRKEVLLADSESTSDEGGSPSGDLSPDPADTQIRRLRGAVSEVRQQRLVTQTLWDFPLVLIHLDMRGDIQTSIGGALRMEAFPNSLSVGRNVKGTQVEYAFREVVHSPRRYPFEIRHGGRTFTAVASPWVTMSGRLRGVAVVILSADDVTQSDECDVVPFRVVSSNGIPTNGR